MARQTAASLGSPLADGHESRNGNSAVLDMNAENNLVAIAKAPRVSDKANGLTKDGANLAVVTASSLPHGVSLVDSLENVVPPNTNLRGRLMEGGTENANEGR